MATINRTRRRCETENLMTALIINLHRDTKGQAGNLQFPSGTSVALFSHFPFEELRLQSEAAPGHYPVAEREPAYNPPVTVDHRPKLHVPYPEMTWLAFLRYKDDRAVSY